LNNRENRYNDELRNFAIGSIWNIMEKESESELENKINIESENKKRVKENIH
jgi:hypothetical protein